ncbi:MAG: Hpt domain-containing protein [Gemmatimonadaceae bacterium]
MTSSAGLLDFFILEASDYAERLDGLVATSGPEGPDADALCRHARALRGSATMAKLGGIAEVAGGVERVGRGLREGTLRWDPSLAGAVVAAIDELKTLIRATRTWGSAEDRRARARAAELAAITAGVRPSNATPTSAGTGFAWLASEANEIAAGLGAVAAAPPPAGAEPPPRLAEAMRRVRAMRGVAAVKDHPALAGVLEGIERAAKPLELRSGVAVREAVDVLSAGVDALRRIARDIGASGTVGEGSPELERFGFAADAFGEAAEGAERVLPVASLFHDDGGPHVVTRAPAPPTTPAQRFRMEVVSQAEHLRALVAQGRRVRDAAERDRVGRALRSALRALRDLADSFGERPVATYVDASSDAARRLDALTLGGLDELAALLANPGTRAEELERRVSTLVRGRGVDAAIGAAMAGATDREPAGVKAAEPPRADEALPPIDTFLYAPAAPDAAPVPKEAAAPAPRPPTPAHVEEQDLAREALLPARYPTPSGRELHALLEDTIVGIARLEDAPLAEPVDVVDDTMVDVGALLYRGRSALARARELVNEMRTAGSPPTQDAVEELLDLIELGSAR